MSDLEEVDVTKQIDTNDDVIVLSEPESGTEDLEEGEIPEEELEEGEIPEDEEELEEGEIPEEDLEEGEIPEDEETIKKEATVIPSLGVDTYIPQQINLENEETKNNILSKSKQAEKSNTQEKGNVSDSSDSENEDDYDEELQKIEKEINKDFLLDYHPELKQINYKELLTLCKVVRNKKGNIIDPLHTTIPFLTRYEKAKVLGLRAKQINNGADPLIDLPRSIIDGHTIALMELKENKIPFIIKRPIPNGGNEYWKVSDLSNLE